MLDFETTGVDPLKDRIVTIGLVLVDSVGTQYGLPGSYSATVNPGIPIPTGASDIHGVTTEIAKREGVPPREALQELYDRLQAIHTFGWPLLMFNAPYDWTMLRAELMRNGMPWEPWLDEIPLLDPLVIDRKMDRFRKGGRKLKDMADHYGVWLPHAHDAWFDCTATADVMRAICKKQKSIREQTLANLHESQKLWFADWKYSFSKHLRKQGKPPITGEWPFGS